MATVIPIKKNINKVNYISDDNIDVLTRIYDEDINLVIYKREVSAEIIQYVSKLLEQSESISYKQVLKLDEVKQQLKMALPDYDYKDTFISDLYNFCDMFSILFDLEHIGLRLSRLEHAMCPRFHVDNIPCRLLITYGGVGSEWLSEDNVDRKKLGRGNQGLPDTLSGIYVNEGQINRIEPYDVALLKGEAWTNNSGKGIVHRSPEVNKTSPRLLLSLDFV